MAYQGKHITNPVTGQSIIFLQTSRDTDGKLLEMETEFAPRSVTPAPHFHPFQEELFTVISGELTVNINGKTRKLTPGMQVHVNKNEVHAMWNNSAQRTLVNWKVYPAMDTEEFLENLMGLAADGKTNKEGRPSLLQVALLAQKFDHVFRLAQPPRFAQKILFGILKPFALVAGYRASYKKYTD